MLEMLVLKFLYFGSKKNLSSWLYICTQRYNLGLTYRCTVSQPPSPPCKVSLSYHPLGFPSPPPKVSPPKTSPSPKTPLHSELGFPSCIMSCWSIHVWCTCIYIHSEHRLCLKLYLTQCKLLIIMFILCMVGVVVLICFYPYPYYLFIFTRRTFWTLPCSLVRTCPMYLAVWSTLSCISHHDEYNINQLWEA